MLQLQKKEAEKQFELAQQDAEYKQRMVTNGVLWRLRSQTQRHVMEQFLFDCCKRLKQFSEDEILKIGQEIKKLPKVPKGVTLSAANVALYQLSAFFELP
mmetsp:Transcript_40705/g.63560  ORF Transcript_40705/g.63560 Transcript_40705/m.63560 type:complete len:100 (+) Transcript_40705:158-457(+)